MRKQDAGFDFHRYRQLPAKAVDDTKQLALIDILIEERAKEQLDAFVERSDAPDLKAAERVLATLS